MQDSEKVTELDPHVFQHVTHEIINGGGGTSNYHKGEFLFLLQKLLGDEKLGDGLATMHYIVRITACR